MMREHRDRLGCFGVDQIGQAPGARGAKVASVATGIERIDRDQPDRIILDRIRKSRKQNKYEYSYARREPTICHNFTIIGSENPNIKPLKTMCNNENDMPAVITGQNGPNAVASATLESRS